VKGPRDDMTTVEFVAMLGDVQSADGAFPSTVHWQGGRHQDWNGFTTALVLRALHHFPGLAALQPIRDRALGFLLRCKVADPPGAFGF